jgi:hypothetical protein
MALNDFNKVLVLESLKRLSDWRPAESSQGGKRTFRPRAAWLELMSHNHFLKALQCLSS